MTEKKGKPVENKIKNDVTNEANYNPTNDEPQIKRVLVVISPDLIKPGAPPKDSALVTRAIALAKATGCELEFFHLCYDGSLTSGFFSDDSEVLGEQLNRLNQEATLVAELVVGLSSEGVKITHDTRWDSPRSEAILRKVNESQPDLVMKQSGDHGYIMGLRSNTDWDLIRHSPAHLWFVNGEGEDNIDSLVTAVGASYNNDEILAAADYRVFRMANLVAECFDATNTPVHPYQAPVGMSTDAGYTPVFGGFSVPMESEVRATEEACQQIAREHGKCIEAFAESFHIDPKRVRVAQGRPSDVITEAAIDVEANLIVVAARNLSRWERLSQSVTAEPLLAEAPCDVLFVKDADDAVSPEMSRRPLIGAPVYDLENAMIDPDRVFGSPQLLGEASQISVPMRHRILEIWKQNILVKLANENEGGLIQMVNTDLLESIKNTQTLLREQSDDSPEKAIA